MAEISIAVAGLGYVGLSLATLLARQAKVVAVDVVPEKVDLVNAGLSPLSDPDIEEILAAGGLRLSATLDAGSAYKDADYVIIATPTDYDPELNHFDTSCVEAVVGDVLRVNPQAVMVIKSTVPVGYTEYLSERYSDGHFLFSPEFLREGRALFDNLYPSRIIVGVPGNTNDGTILEEHAREFTSLLAACAAEEDVPQMVMGSTEAEAVKLFSNAYLALRVAYFNELDTFANIRSLNSQNIIEGVGFDPRIGSHYNNPSFGYGGYCLPKDTKQLLANYENVPQNLIGAIVEANRTRKEYVADCVIRRVDELKSRGIQSPVVGIFRLTMKAGSDNFRTSSIQDILAQISGRDIAALVYEPTLQEPSFRGVEVTHDLDAFKSEADIIVANRWSDSLSDVSDKVFTRDLFGRD